MSLSAVFLLLIPNHHKVVQECQNGTSAPPPLPHPPISHIDTCRNFFMKNGQKQVKKKAFKINAKFEDVGLNED